MIVFLTLIICEQTTFMLTAKEQWGMQRNERCPFIFYLSGADPAIARLWWWSLNCLIYVKRFLALLLAVAIACCCYCLLLLLLAVAIACCCYCLLLLLLAVAIACCCYCLLLLLLVIGNNAMAPPGPFGSTPGSLDHK